MTRADTSTDARPVLFIQGGGAGTHDGWDHRLVASLMGALGRGYSLHYPHMPQEADPDYKDWSAAIAREVAALNGGAILVGHSIGATVLIHTLARNPRLLRGVTAICLIAAPYVGEGGWPSAEITAAADWASPLTDTTVYLYQGDADDTTPMTHFDLYAGAMPHALLRLLAGRDHQLGDDLTEVAQDINGLGTSA